MLGPVGGEFCKRSCGENKSWGGEAGKVAVEGGDLLESRGGQYFALALILWEGELTFKKEDQEPLLERGTEAPSVSVSEDGMVLEPFDV